MEKLQKNLEKLIKIIQQKNVKGSLFILIFFQRF